MAYTKFDTRPSPRTSSPSWGLHRKIRPLLVKSSAILESSILDTKFRSTTALTSLHLQLLLLIEAIQKAGFWSSGFNSKLTFTPSPTEQSKQACCDVTGCRGPRSHWSTICSCSAPRTHDKHAAATQAALQIFTQHHNTTSLFPPLSWRLLINGTLIGHPS